MQPRWDQPAALRGTKPQHSEKAKQAERAHDGSAGGADESGPTKDRVVEIELHSCRVSRICDNGNLA